MSTEQQQSSPAPATDSIDAASQIDKNIIHFIEGRLKAKKVDPAAVGQDVKEVVAEIIKTAISFATPGHESFLVDFERGVKDLLSNAAVAKLKQQVPGVQRAIFEAVPQSILGAAKKIRKAGTKKAKVAIKSLLDDEVKKAEDAETQPMVESAPPAAPVHVTGPAHGQ
jgi:hypothetical protein